MDYYGLLFLYYLKGLSGKSVLKLFFNVGAGGTEQLLPENTSTPTTTPILADIQYPDGLRTDQYFTYRETPATVSNKARIKTIKGNTLVWNQLVQNGNFATANGWASSSSTNMTIVGASNNRLLFTTSSTIAAIVNTQVLFPKNHKLLFKLSTDLSKLLKIRLYTRDWVTLLSPTELSKSGDFQYLVINPLTDDAGTLYIIPSVNDNVQHYISNVQVFDLTALGIDNLTNNEVLERFANYFPLPYYDYNAGTLLSFNGTGLKTVGKNLLNNVRTVGTTYTISGVNIVLREDGSYKLEGTCTSNNVLNLVTLSGVNNGVLFPKGSYVLSGSLDGISSSTVELQYYIPSIGSGNRSTSPISFTLNEPADVAIRIYLNNGKTYDDVVYPMLRFADAFDSTFELYTSNTTNLPIATYFPTGMKSAGTVYDELTPSKAITRIGSVDLGTLNWSYSSTYKRFSTDDLMPNIVKVDNITTLKSTIYIPSEQIWLADGEDKTMGHNASGRLYVRNLAYTDASAFKSAMNGVPLLFELENPTETPITTASLVTENAEIPLSNEDGVLIGKCTEQLSAEPGFHDAKIETEPIEEPVEDEPIEEETEPIEENEDGLVNDNSND